jgi:phosphoenolpyruvate carboxykinase (GTP)
MIEEFYAKFGDKIPHDLRNHLEELKKKLGL